MHYIVHCIVHYLVHYIVHYLVHYIVLSGAQAAPALRWSYLDPTEPVQMRGRLEPWGGSSAAAHNGPRREPEPRAGEV